MLANRADTYNLGDVIGGHVDVFESSYIENAATSNPTIARVATRHPKDIVVALELAAKGPREGLDFSATYSPEELQEIVSVMKKLLRVRDVVLGVNEEYIRSAAQADAYRTEPPFKLQGSYRNMNRLAEKVSPVMNDAELEGLLQNHYRNEAQTLTTGAEANLLKFREKTSALTPEETARWADIRKTFRKNLMLGGAEGDNDPVSRVVQKLSAFYDGLDGIKEVLAAAVAKPAPVPPKTDPVTIIISPPSGAVSSSSLPLPAREDGNTSDWTREVQITQETLKEIWELIDRQGSKSKKKKQS